MASGAVRKRRVIGGCANPLFVKWVEELRDEAVEKGVKSHFSYTKALSSLRRYPLPLSSGQEAKILDHVGEKLAKLLDKKSKQHQEVGEGTVSDTLSNGTTSSLTETKLKKTRQSPKLKNSPKKRKKSASSSSMIAKDHTSAATAPSDTATPKPKRRKSAPREYIPVYRSGPYALIIALHQAEEKPSWCGYLKKTELIAEAQPLSDSSFTVCDSGSYYNAWSSMSILVEKGLVVRYSHPPKFKLSEKGVSMAVRLLRGNDLTSNSSTRKSTVGQSTSSCSTAASPKTMDMKVAGEKTSGSKCRQFVPSPPTSPWESGVLDTDSISSYEIEELDIDGSHSLLPDPPPTHSRRWLQFWYISPEGHQVHGKDGAAITFNDELSVGFLIKCKRKELEESSFKYTIDHFREPEGEFVYAYLSNEQGPDLSNPPSDVPHNSKFTISETPLSCRTDSSSNFAPSSETRTTPCSTKGKTNDAPILITLSDSESDGDSVSCLSKINLNSSILSDEVEIMQPLADRIGLKRSHDLQSNHSNDAKSSSDLFIQCSSSKLLSPVSNGSLCTKSLSSETNFTLLREVSEEDTSVSLTPSHQAGMAALKRFESKLSTPSKAPEHSKSTSVGKTLMREGNYKTTKITNRDMYGGNNEKERSCVLSSARTLKPPKNINSESTTTAKRHSSTTATKELNSKMHTSPVIVDLTSSSDNGAGDCTKSDRNSNIERSKVKRSHDMIARDQAGGGGGGVSRRSDEDVDLSSPEFVLRPGDYDVILCVDSAESTASRKQSSQFRGLLLQELGKNGVLFDVRKLNVGDFLWVAREKATPTPGQLSLPQTREVVLEYIVERKRMDDLAGSITDGRFKEQKFRLKNCAVCHPIYLVEEYKDMGHLRLPQRSLNQAITNTQIIDGFYVKRTKDIRESIAYLTLMTRQLQSYYANKTLKAYPCESITELLKSTTGRRGRSTTGDVVYSMPFGKFNEASVKNKVLSVYEMFGRHLMQLPLFSADKALAVLEVYPTISHLRQAYRDCPNATERAKLLSNIKAGKNKRRLGDKLSSVVYSVYWLGKDTS